MGHPAGTSDIGTGSTEASARRIRASDSRVERFVALLVLVISCAYLLLFRRYVDLDPDEGIILQGAQRILRGEVLYRDFFAFYTPGSYYFLVCLLKIFGNSLLAARTALACLGGVLSLFHYLLARRVCSRGSALVTTGLVTLTCLPFRFLVLHNWDSTLGACLALYGAVRWMETQTPVDSQQSKVESEPSAPGPYHLSPVTCFWAFATGSFASLTFLFEQSKGAGLILGLLAGYGLIAWRRGGLWALPQSAIENRKSKMSPIRYSLLPTPFWVLAGFAWPFLLTFLYFGAQHSLSPMLADWLWPLRNYTSANRVPYGYQEWSESDVHLLFFSGSWVQRLVTLLIISPSFLVPVLPLIAGVLLVYWSRRLRGLQDLALPASDESPRRCAYYVLVNATLCGLLLSVVTVRANVIHFVYLGPLFYLVLAWAMEGRDIPGRIFAALRPLWNAYVVVAFGLLSLPFLLRTLQAPYRLETRQGLVTMPGKDTVIDYLQDHVPPGGKILVYPYLPLYYYLTGTFSPSRYDYFQPGMHTRQQSREMLSELATQRVEAVLLELSFPNKIPISWPETPVTAFVDDPVGEYIARNYRLCARLKSLRDRQFLFMRRKGLACP